MSDSLEALWKTALAQIEVKLDSPAHFKTWFKDTTLLSIDGNTAHVGVKNTYSVEWLSKKHKGMIKETICYVSGQDNLKVKFSVDKSLANSKLPEAKNVKQERGDIFSVKNGVPVQHTNRVQDSGLTAHYTFNNFIVGESNQLAHAAALGVSKEPGAVYNPLFIHGKTGLGKTHLAQAVGRSVIDRIPTSRIVYVASETFMNEMINAIQNAKNSEFREKFRSVDVLIIDDVQLMAKREKTQEEFFNTFNVLYQANKQIVLTSDVPPENLKDIDDRIVSRFQGGMVVEVYKPNLETRYAILRKKSQKMGFQTSDRVFDYLAKEITDNIRELEGALQKISLYGSMVDGELSTQEIAKIIGRDARSKRQKVKIPQILKRVGKEFDVTVKDIKGRKRTASVAFARQVCMFIIREEFKYKLEQTARFLNRKDHTTVIHAVDKVSTKIELDEGFKEQINLILEDLK